MSFSIESIKTCFMVMLFTLIFNALLPFFMIFQQASLEHRLSLTTNHGTSLICHETGFETISQTDSQLKKIVQDFNQDIQQHDSKIKCPICYLFAQSLGMIMPVIPVLSLPLFFNPPADFVALHYQKPHLFLITDYLHAHAPPVYS